MRTSVVLFKDKAYNVDFGLLIPDYGVLCLCCGIVFDFGDVEILYNFQRCSLPRTSGRIWWLLR